MYNDEWMQVYYCKVIISIWSSSSTKPRNENIVNFLCDDKTTPLSET